MHPPSPDRQAVLTPVALTNPHVALALGTRQATLGGARTLAGPGDSSQLIFSGETAAPPAPAEDLANARSSAWLRGHELGACPQSSTLITLMVVRSLLYLSFEAAPRRTAALGRHEARMSPRSVVLGDKLKCRVRSNATRSADPARRQD